MIEYVAFFLWVLSAYLSGFIMAYRDVDLNPLSLSITVCPIVNTLYVLIRIKHLKEIIPDLCKGWFKDTLKKL